MGHRAAHVRRWPGEPGDRRTAGRPAGRRFGRENTDGPPGSAGPGPRAALSGRDTTGRGSLPCRSCAAGGAGIAQVAAAVDRQFRRHEAGPHQAGLVSDGQPGERAQTRLGREAAPCDVDPRLLHGGDAGHAEAVGGRHGRGEPAKQIRRRRPTRRLRVVGRGEGVLPEADRNGPA